MCGISGFCDFNRKLNLADLKRSTDTLHHRGPDDSGYDLFELNNATVGFGQRRLSILDLSPLGHQPMFDDSRRHAIILNGEIYNFMEIRKPLEELGYSFRSHSDTEVALIALKHYGLKAIDQFIGMFAIAYLDLDANQLYLIRDRAGVKPFYYYHNNNQLLFASELKALHAYPGFSKEVNPMGVHLFFKYWYIPAPHTIFKHTHKLLPGHYLQVNCTNGDTSLHKYWDVYDYYNQPELMISEQEALDQTEKLLTSAFQYRMIADVPVGVFLSGGYDSSVLTALLQVNTDSKIKTFTIGFTDQQYNEAVYARKVAEHLGTEHHEHYCTHKEAADIIPDLPEFFDEPFGDPSAIPTILVSRVARKDVTVALSADAGDELFAGYHRYRHIKKLQGILNPIPGFLTGATSSVLKAIDADRLPVLKNNQRFVENYKFLQRFSHTKNPFEHNSSLSTFYSDKELKQVLKQVSDQVYEQTYFDSNNALKDHRDSVTRILAVDYKTYLADDILTKVDRATMSASLEGREPYLDHRLVEWLAQLPLSLKMKGVNQKYLLKKIAHKYIPETMMERPKMGFGPPIGSWFQNEMKDLLHDYLSKEAIEANEWLQLAGATQIVKEYEANPSEQNSFRIWILIVFQMWWKRWMS